MGLVVGVLLILWPTVICYQQGKALNVVAGCLALVATLLLAAAYRQASSANAMRLSADERGTTLEVQPAARALSAVGLLVGCLAVALLGYLQYRGAITWDRTSRTRGAWVADVAPVGLPVLGLAAVAMVPYALNKIVDAGSASFLRAEPAGVRMVFNHRKERFLEWGEIADIQNGVMVNGRRSPAAVLFPREGRKVTAPTGMSENAYRAAELLRFYWLAPDRRAELTDGRALGRLRGGEFNPGYHDADTDAARR